MLVFVKFKFSLKYIALFPYTYFALDNVSCIFAVYISNLDICINNSLCDKCISGNDLQSLSDMIEAILFICNVFSFCIFSNPSFRNNKLIPMFSPLILILLY